MEHEENKEFHVEEHEENKESHVEEHDRFTRFMFGDRRNRHFQHKEDQDREPSAANQGNQIHDLLSNVDIDELMKNIDTFMSSTSHFKPLLNKLAPLINKWIK
ncbi:hypothetical protein R4Z09_22990 [Niallia oryzisoli]|uniref:Uncharacterized protein n=1 Tax=Niallia oryzisoli TaxID=1737571 RepID=A0ABZ2CAQ3_9BACI